MVDFRQYTIQVTGESIRHEHYGHVTFSIGTALLFALLKLRWLDRSGMCVARDAFPTIELTLTSDARCTASGWRNDAENYLFLNRTDADKFRGRIKQIRHAALKPKIQILEITAEEVAHLDLDPVQRCK